MSLIDSLERIRKILPLIGRITIRQALEQGHDVIDACGLNPWCVNEGLAEGHEEAFSSWQRDIVRDDLDAAIKALEQGGWSDIASAPDDGTPILVVDIKCDDPMPIIVHWAQHDSWGPDPAWLVGHKWETSWVPSHIRAQAAILGIIPWPTHWQALPKVDSIPRPKRISVAM